MKSNALYPNEIAEESKIWIFQSSRDFTQNEIFEIERELSEFIQDWNAHGAALTATFWIPYGRFIVISADENRVQASGCSIDSMTRKMKAIEENYNFGLLNRMLVSYKSKGEIFTLPLADLKQKIQSGELNDEINVFNNGVSTLNQFQTSWELPLQQSWAAKFMNSSQTN